MRKHRMSISKLGGCYVDCGLGGFGSLGKEITVIEDLLLRDEIEDGILVLGLIRPDSLNAINAELAAEVCFQFRSCRRRRHDSG